MPDGIRVLVADDDSLVREVLAEMIAVEPGLDLVGVAADADEAIELCEAVHPDVVLIDVRMPAGGGARATREIRQVSPGTHIVALSALADRGTESEMLDAGADTYLVKGSSARSVIEALKSVVAT